MEVRSRILEEQSRELCLACDASGAVTWADDRARTILGISPGVRFLSLAAPGTEAKAAEFLRRGGEAPVRGWEIPLAVGGRAVTLLFSAVPSDEGLLLLGSTIPEDYQAMVAQVSDAMNEVVHLNREIARQKKQLEQQREELLRLNRALEDSTKGVMTLHAELEDRAVALREAADVRGRVVANVSHEFRTPLHTILGLSRLLLDESDGPLADEQKKQVRFIRTSAEELANMVNDLLDLSKVDSGKMNLRPEEFDAADFFGALRGMLRPTLPEQRPVELIFEEPAQPIRLETDRAKLSQIMRNLISNALKFTDRGEVRVSARSNADGTVSISVADTGIGIAPADLDRVFEEFSQIDSVQQRKVKGTGLGLPLARKLAELLDGSLLVQSRLGEGSTFTVTIPATLPEAAELHALEERSKRIAPGEAPVLVVEDDRKTIFLYERYLSLAGFHVIPARTVEEARQVMTTVRPAAVVLDIFLEGETTWDFLGELKSNPGTADIPVLVVTVTNKEQKARALGADEFWLKPLDQERLLRKLRGIARPGHAAKVLIIDDDERSRYLLRKYLAGTPYEVVEASTGPEGMQIAQDAHPDVIFLDFLLRDETALDVLDDLKADPRTRTIPVIINTSHQLQEEEKQRLAGFTEAILSKESLSRELAINRIRDALSKVGVGVVRKE